MLLYKASWLLPILLCMSLADTTTTLPEFHKPIPTPLHSHAQFSVSTFKGSPHDWLDQEHPTGTPNFPSSASEPTSSAFASPTTSGCPPLQSPCGGTGCYDPHTEQCCNEESICKITQNCVQVQLHNGTIATGCCPGATLACDGFCFDASTSKCCAAPGGTYGLCSVNQDCCGDMCCDEGAVCASGFAGPMCWQRHSNATEQSVSAPSLSETTAIQSTRASGSTSIAVPKLFRVLLVFARLVVGVLSEGFPATRLQLPPTPHSNGNPDTSNSTSPLNKHWSCHAPMLPCGDGCHEPSTTRCCQQDGATFSTCHSGGVCCQSYCCPPDTTCMIASSAHSAGPWCWPLGLPKTVENVPFDENPWPLEASMTGLKNTRIENGSTGTRTSTLLYVLFLLLALVTANSALQLVSMNTVTKTVNDSAATVSVVMPRHTPTELGLDVNLSEKKALLEEVMVLGVTLVLDLVGVLL